MRALGFNIIFNEHEWMNTPTHFIQFNRFSIWDYKNYILFFCGLLRSNENLKKSWRLRPEIKSSYMISWDLSILLLIFFVLEKSLIIYSFQLILDYLFEVFFFADDDDTTTWWKICMPSQMHTSREESSFLVGVVVLWWLTTLANDKRWLSTTRIWIQLSDMLSTRVKSSHWRSNLLNQVLHLSLPIWVWKCGVSCRVFHNPSSCCLTNVDLKTEKLRLLDSISSIHCIYFLQTQNPYFIYQSI